MLRIGKLVPVYRCEHAETREGPWGNPILGSEILKSWDDPMARPNLYFDGFREYFHTRDCKVVVTRPDQLLHWFPRQVHSLIKQEGFRFVEYRAPDWAIIVSSSQLQAIVNRCFLHSPLEIRL